VWRCGMKRMLLGALSVALVASSLALAQDQAKPAKSDNPGAWATGAKPLTVSGKIGNDGKTFLTDIDTEWNVSNAEAVKGYEGRLATVKCFVDPERNRIRVLSVKASDVKTASKTGDSAFRR